MAVDFSKWDKQIDINDLKAKIEETEKNGGTGNFEDVPLGKYEVSVEKLELVASKAGDPMVSCWFNIVNGKHKGQKLFMNQVVKEPFQIHMANVFLKSLDSGVDVKFDSYSQYGEMILDIHESIDGVLEYEVDYKENSKGYKTFKVTEIFEL